MGQPADVTARMGRLYAELLRRLEHAPGSRHGRFMNFGYRARPGEQTAGPPLPPRLPGRDSAQLALEVVGDTDVRGRVLEVGCGRGGNLWVLHRLLGAETVVGIDLVPAAVAFAGRDARARQALFLVGDAELLPFADRSVDVVLSIESSSTYGDPEAFLRGVARVLRPGGTFAHADLLPADLVPELRRAVAALGLREVHHRDISANVAESAIVLDGRAALGSDVIPTGHRYVVHRFVATGDPVPADAVLGADARARWAETAAVGEGLLVELLDGGAERWAQPRSSRRA